MTNCSIRISWFLYIDVGTRDLLTFWKKVNELHFPFPLFLNPMTACTIFMSLQPYKHFSKRLHKFFSGLPNTDMLHPWNKRLICHSIRYSREHIQAESGKKPARVGHRAEIPTLLSWSSSTKVINYFIISSTQNMELFIIIFDVVTPICEGHMLPSVKVELKASV